MRTTRSPGGDVLDRFSVGNGINISASFGMSGGLSASSAMIMASSSGNLGLGLRYKARRATETASLAAMIHMAALPVIVPLTVTPAQAQTYTADVGNGLTVTGDVLNDTDDLQSVHHGGVASGTTINDGAQNVYSNGVTNGTIMNGGVQRVVSDGSANGTIINGGDQRVRDGGSASDTQVRGSGAQNVSAGGVADNTHLSDGGRQNVFVGGTATGTVVSDGGDMRVSGGSSQDAQVLDGGRQYVYENGVASNTVVETGGYHRIFAGGSSIDADMKTGSELHFAVEDGKNTGVTGIHHSAGAFDYSNAGRLENKILHDGMRVHIANGGSADNTILLDNAYQYVRSGGTATSAQVSNGGREYVLQGGVASDTTVFSGGSQTISAGLADNTTILSSGVQHITLDGSATNTQIKDGGAQHVRWGEATSSIISAGGSQYVSVGSSGAETGSGAASAAQVLDGGFQEIRGGSASDTMVSAGGTQHVRAGSASGTIVDGTQRFIVLGDGNGGLLMSGGTATDNTIRDGGSQRVWAGTAIGNTIENGAEQHVGGTFNSSGDILASGVVINTSVAEGAKQAINSGGSAVDNIVDGLQIIHASGYAENNTVSGVQYVSSGGTANNNTVHGTQFIRDGGLASGVVARDGGVVNVRKGGVISGEARFESGSTLQGNATISGGDLTFEDGSTLEIVIREPSANSDILTVKNITDSTVSTVTIKSGANLSLIQGGAIPQWSTGKFYTIINSESEISGQFDNIDYGGIPVSPFVTISQEKRANGLGDDLILIAKYNADNPVIDGGTDNQKATNTGVDCLPDGHAVKDAMINAPGAEPALELLDQLSGEAHKSISNALASHFRTRNVDTLFYVSWAKARPYGFDSLSSQPVETPLTPTPRGNGLWVDISGAYTSIDGNSWPVGTAKAELYGPEVALGYDYRSADGWIAGGSFRYGDLTGKVDRRLSEADIDSYNLLVYGGKEISLEDGLLRLALGGAYGYDRVDMSRKINAASYTDNLNTSYGAHSYQVFGEAAYAFTTANMFTTEPFVNLSWDSRFNDSFCESGGPAALCSQSDTQNTLMSIVGVRDFVPAHERVSVAYELGWVHTYGSMNDTWNMGFCDGACNYDIRGAVDSRDAAKVKVGVGVRMTDDLQGSLVYNGLIGGDSSSHGGTFRLTWSW